jgi:hypothetical protein
MDNNLLGFIKGLFVLRLKPGKDLVVVGVSWILVVVSLYTAKINVGADTGGGIPYFLLHITDFGVDGSDQPFFFEGNQFSHQLEIPAGQFLTGFHHAVGK